MENDYFFALILGILLILGLASTRLVKKIKLPNVTGFLVIGIVVALACIGIDYATDSKLGLTNEINKLNTMISSIALGFIALSIGEEFKVSKIKKYGFKIISITLLQALTACLLVDGAVVLTCWLLDLPMYVGIILGAIATATAPAATLMVINQYKAKGPLVDLLLPVVAFDDAVGLIIFSISVSIAKTMAVGSALDVMSLLVIPLVNIFGSIGIGLLLGVLLKLIIKFYKSRNNHLMMLISFTLLGVGICSVINATCKIGDEGLEFSNLLCCMMIGATYINLARTSKEIVKRDFHLVDRWTPFLFLLFFVLSGCHLITSGHELFFPAESSGPSMVVPALIIFAVYLVARSLGKYFGASVGCALTKQPKTNTKYLGITLLPQAGVAIGMANVISQIPEFKVNQTGNIIVTVVLLATLVYELFGPLLTKWALTRAGEIPTGEEDNTPYGEVSPEQVKEEIEQAIAEKKEADGITPSIEESTTNSNEDSNK